MFVHLGPDFSKPKRFLLSPYDGPDTFYSAGMSFPVEGIFLEPGSLDPDPEKPPQKSQWVYWNSSLICDI